MDDFIEDELKLMEERDQEEVLFSSKEFKRPIHELNLRPVEPLDEEQTLEEALILMQKHRFGSCVITKNKKISGILTERDILLKIVGIVDDYKKVKLKDVMTPNPLYLMKDDMIAYVMNNMHVGGFRHIPIVDENEYPISVVSIKCVNSWLLDHFPASVTNITGRPFRGVSKREDA